jgi:hypothetical protein
MDLPGTAPGLECRLLSYCNVFNPAVPNILEIKELDMRRNKKRHWLAPGKASNYISPCTLGQGDKAVLCCRVSGHEQRRRGNLENQERRLREEMQRRGVVVVGGGDRIRTCDLEVMSNESSI